jgi:hypothetical protein
LSGKYANKPARSAISCAMSGVTTPLDSSRLERDGQLER